MKILLSFFCYFLLFSSCAAKAGAMKEEKHLWPSCIAGFCFDQQAQKESVLTDAYGLGYFERQEEKSVHCYRIDDQNFLTFTIYNDNPPFVQTISLTNISLCKNSKKPVKSFKNIGTLEGVALGDSYKKIIKIYGEPQYIKEASDLDVLIRDTFPLSKLSMSFDKAVAYGPNKENDLLVTWFFLRNGIVSAMVMSISE